MLKNSKRLLKLALVGAGCVGAATLALNPKLLKHPTQFFLAALRLMRCGFYGSLVLASYYVSFLTSTLYHRKYSEKSAIGHTI